MFSFENLVVYQKTRKLVKEVYLIQEQLPAQERYALGDQIRRSITSVASNIAESGRDSLKDKAHFCVIAFGSLMEAFSQLQTAQDFNYISENEVERLRPQIEEVSKMLSGLKSSFEKVFNL